MGRGKKYPQKDREREVKGGERENVFDATCTCSDASYATLSIAEINHPKLKFWEETLFGARNCSEQL